MRMRPCSFFGFGREADGNLRFSYGGVATNFFICRGYTWGQGGGAVTVYLDLVIALNFLVDFLLLLGTNKLSGFPAGGKRCALGAALGALYSGICMVSGFRFLGNFLWRTVFLLLMGAVAFGWNRSGWKRMGVFLILSMALGGLAVSMGRGDFLGIALGAGGIWMLSYLAFGGNGSREYVPLRITYREKSVSAMALRDTGNTLRDPITGEQVFLISAQLAEKLTGLTASQLANPLETLTKRPVPGLRLIPYRAVGCDSGMLLGMKFPEVMLGQTPVDAVIAFAPAGLGQESMVEALVTG